jgi:F420-non-reducing hydrogenase iron-sulfur subunit
MDLPYEPVIIAFLCNWCSYRAADLAGTARLRYAPNMRPIRVMCSGRVEPDLVLKAFEQGADGVLIAGCHPGECHYSEGNMKALRRYTLLKRMLAQFGIEPERFQILWASASEGSQLAETVNRMTEDLMGLGPLRWYKTVISGNGRGKEETSLEAAVFASGGEVEP